MAVDGETDTSYADSYYVPGHLGGQKVLCLIDTGCTANILSWNTYQKWKGRDKPALADSRDRFGTLADGTPMTFRGKVQTEFRLRTHPFEESFLVGEIREEVILGMPFLRRYGCSLDFSEPSLRFGDQKLVCTDRHGKALQTMLFAIRRIVMPAESEMMVQCRSSMQPSTRLGRVEPLGTLTVGVAASVNCVDEHSTTWIRCLNPNPTTTTIKSGQPLGRFCCIRSQDVLSTDGLATKPPLLRQCNTSKTTIRLPGHLSDLFRTASLDPEVRQHEEDLRQLLSRNADIFSETDNDLGRTNLVHHEIPLVKDTRPIRQPARRLGPVKEEEVARQVGEMQRQGLIEPGHGAWSSPVVLVRKKDGSWRFCVDYRRLNAVTQADAFPLPRIDESLDALAGNRWFTTLDLTSGYWQVPLSCDAQEKAAFVTRDGLWQWKVLPFGLTSAPATFQRLMERVLRGLHWKTLLLYLDDIIVMGPDVPTHLRRLEEVFCRLRTAGLKVKPRKCELLRREVRYLGHVVSEQGVATEPEKVQAIVTWPRPTDVTAVRAFLGTVSYYRQYIPRFAEIARPLHRLTQKGTPWSWPMEAETAFQTLRRCLVTAPILAYPDPAKRFVVDTDASKESLGAVLSQLDEDGSERVIAYYSKSMTQPERNYCVTRKELLAVVRAVGHFRPYLYGQNFLLRTDHAALVWLMKTSTPEGQVARWLSMLGEFCFEMKHRPGRLHSNADGLSRRPCPSECRQCSRFGPDIEERPLEVTHLAPVRVDGEQLLRLTDESNPGQLARTQACDAGYVTIVYDAVLRSRELPQDLLQRSGAELATLARLVPSMFIDEQDVLRVRLGDRRTPALCPPRWREELVWLVHRQAHAGAAAVV